MAGRGPVVADGVLRLQQVWSAHEMPKLTSPLTESDRKWVDEQFDPFTRRWTHIPASVRTPDVGQWLRVVATLEGADLDYVLQSHWVPRRATLHLVSRPELLRKLLDCQHTLRCRATLAVRLHLSGAVQLGLAPELKDAILDLRLDYRCMPGQLFDLLDIGARVYKPLYAAGSTIGYLDLKSNYGPHFGFLCSLGITVPDTTPRWPPVPLELLARLCIRRYNLDTSALPPVLARWVREGMGLWTFLERRK